MKQTTVRPKRRPVFIGSDGCYVWSQLLQGAQLRAHWTELYPTKAFLDHLGLVKPLIANQGPLGSNLGRQWPSQDFLMQNASKDFFVLLLAFFFHRNFTPEILTNRKSYTGKYYTGKYTYWKMLHRNFVTQELLYRNLSYTGKTNPEKVRPDNWFAELDIPPVSVYSWNRLLQARSNGMAIQSIADWVQHSS